jgi:hypothetical protein
MTNGFVVQSQAIFHGAEGRTRCFPQAQGNYNVHPGSTNTELTTECYDLVYELPGQYEQASISGVKIRVFDQTPRINRYVTCKISHLL